MYFEFLFKKDRPSAFRELNAYYCSEEDSISDLQAYIKHTGRTLDKMLDLLDTSYSKQCHQSLKTKFI